QVHLLHLPHVAQRLEIVHLFVGTDRHIASDGRATAAALVIIHQRAIGGDRIESGQQVVVMCPGSAVQHHHFGTGTDPPFEDLDPSDLTDGGPFPAAHSSSANAAATLRLASTSSSVNGSTWSESTSIWPMIVSPLRISTTSSERVNRLQAM